MPGKRKGHVYKRMVFHDGIQRVVVNIRNVGEFNPALVSGLQYRVAKECGAPPQVQIYGHTQAVGSRRINKFSLNVPENRTQEFIKLVSDPAETEVELEDDDGLGGFDFDEDEEGAPT